jgi:hypothetical protein
VADKALAVIDPSGRLIGELSAPAAMAQVGLRAAGVRDPVADCTAVLVAPALAGDLLPSEMVPMPPGSPAPRRWRAPRGCC